MEKKSAADVFAEYRQRLLRFIRSHIGTLEDAEDILQDVFYQLARMDSLSKPVEQTAVWLYRVARNSIIDRYKKKKDAPLPSYYDEDEDDYIFNDIADIAYGEETTPETEHLRSLILDEIKTALDELPEEQRLVFELTEIVGFSVKEVAEKTHTPLNTVLSRKHYAVKRLRKRLAELYGDVLGTLSNEQ
ncbi:MAG: sigma-70 family RNA polymerase sigma factor [Spirochaetaceae bacterium]|jgi:RNA polymerase sigma factor (sigma-70 family)|nr:sigma-70 family RNA polymerase sigma factor [Spirochaetaceae bacterium]